MVCVQFMTVVCSSTSKEKIKKKIVNKEKKPTNNKYKVIVINDN